MKKLFIILLFFTACSPKIKKLEYINYYDAVEVKNSGGFTGASTGFLIQKNAEIYVTYHTPGKGFNQKFYRLSTVDSVNKMFAILAKSNVSVGVNILTLPSPSNILIGKPLVSPDISASIESFLITGCKYVSS